MYGPVKDAILSSAVGAIGLLAAAAVLDEAWAAATPKEQRAALSWVEWWHTWFVPYSRFFWLMYWSAIILGIACAALTLERRRVAAGIAGVRSGRVVYSDDELWDFKAPAASEAAESGQSLADGAVGGELRRRLLRGLA